MNSLIGRRHVDPISIAFSARERASCAELQLRAPAGAESGLAPAPTTGLLIAFHMEEQDACAGQRVDEQYCRLQLRRPFGEGTRARGRYSLLVLLLVLLALLALASATPDRLRSRRCTSSPPPFLSPLVFRSPSFPFLEIWQVILQARGSRGFHAKNRLST